MLHVSRRVTIPHVDALDGLRGAAVAGVLLFHGGHLTGGYLGVDLFFVLSGFLITTLLLVEGQDRETINLGGFWARRARRLLPALAGLLVGVALYCVVHRGAQRAVPDPGRLALDALLLRQLALDQHRSGLLGALHRTVAARARVEPRDRGAVLRGVAARVRGPARLVEAQDAAGRAGRRPDRRRDLDCADAGALRPDQPEPGVLRHRHPGDGHPARRRAGRDPRHPRTGAGPRLAGRARDRRLGRRRHPRRGVDPARRSVHPPLPGRLRRLWGRGGARDRGDHAPAPHGPGNDARLPAAVLARHHQLRPLPLALAGRRGARRRPHRHRRLDALRAPDRSRDRDRRRVVPLPRTADPARRPDRAPVVRGDPRDGRRARRHHPREHDHPERCADAGQGRDPRVERRDERTRSQDRTRLPRRRLRRGDDGQRAAQRRARCGRRRVPRLQGRARDPPRGPRRREHQGLPVGDGVARTACDEPTQGRAARDGRVRALGREAARREHLSRAGNTGLGGATGRARCNRPSTC